MIHGIIVFGRNFCIYLVYFIGQKIISFSIVMYHMTKSVVLYIKNV